MTRGRIKTKKQEIVTGMDTLRLGIGSITIVGGLDGISLRWIVVTIALCEAPANSEFDCNYQQSDKRHDKPAALHILTDGTTLGRYFG